MTTTPLPEPDLFDGITHSPSGRFTATVNGYTAGKMHEFAAAKCAARDAEIERLRADAARWVWWAEAVANHDLNSIEEAFKDIPHDRPTSKQALDAAIDAKLKENK